jgi:hypothetical protein
MRLRSNLHLAASWHSLDNSSFLERMTTGSSHEYSEVGQRIASSKAVNSAIDSYALRGLKTGGGVANSTGRQTEV